MGNTSAIKRGFRYSMADGSLNLYVDGTEVAKFSTTTTTLNSITNMGSSGTPKSYTAGTPAVAWYFTGAGSGGTNVVPFLVSSTVTGTSPVGCRAYFEGNCNVVAGGWINALKSQMKFGTSGKVTGLASSMCAEMDLPNANLGAGGAYYPLEIELNPGASTVISALDGGNPQCGFMYMAVNTNKDDFDDKGYLFRLEGVSVSSGHIIQESVAEANYSHSLRVSINGVAYAIMMVTDRA